MHRGKKGKSHYLGPTFTGSARVWWRPMAQAGRTINSERNNFEILMLRGYIGGSVALHLSLMASPSCCLPDCGPLKWTDLGHAVFARLSGVCVLVQECLSDGVSVCVGLQDTVNQPHTSDWLADCWWLSGIMSISTFCLCIMNCPLWITACLDDWLVC